MNVRTHIGACLHERLLPGHLTPIISQKRVWGFSVGGSDVDDDNHSTPRPVEYAFRRPDALLDFFIM